MLQRLSVCLLCLVLLQPARSQDDPQLRLWKTIKKTIIEHGDEYFNSSMKDAVLPQLRGKVVKLEPAVAPRTILLAIEDGKTPDATLKFDARLPGKVPLGTELSFEGVAESYTTSPFMVVFEVERTHLHGWPDHKR